MRVQDLIEALSSMPEDAEVRIASQKQWPFEYSVDRIGLVNPRVIRKSEWDAMTEEEQIQIDEDDDVVQLEDHEEEPGPVVYIAEWQQIGYLPKAAARAIEW